MRLFALRAGYIAAIDNVLRYAAESLKCREDRRQSSTKARKMSCELGVVVGHQIRPGGRNGTFPNHREYSHMTSLELSKCMNDQLVKVEFRVILQALGEYVGERLQAVAV